MKTALAFVASLALAACSATPAETTSSGGSTTSGAGGATTGGNGTTGANQGTTGAVTTGGTTGAVVYGPPCASNMWTCPAGSPKAGQVYPGAAPSNCGAQHGLVFPDLEMKGGGILNWSRTETEDNVNNFSSSSTFMHDLFCSGFDYVFIDVSARWCPHCITEAQQIPGWSSGHYSSNSLYQTWLNANGTMLSLLVQSGTPPNSADQNDLNYWIGTYHVPYPLILDTGQDMPGFTHLQGWPENLIIRLSDMVVIDAVGGDVPTFYQEYCSILGVTNCPTP